MTFSNSVLNSAVDDFFSFVQTLLLIPLCASCLPKCPILVLFWINKWGVGVKGCKYPVYFICQITLKQERTMAVCCLAGAGQVASWMDIRAGDSHFHQCQEKASFLSGVASASIAASLMYCMLESLNSKAMNSLILFLAAFATFAPLRSLGYLEQLSRVSS